ncbi:MAG: flippase-like domain-containing protein [Deltaproteobacteria bacterium]|nr:flippase-like domain-containing protein [Deltaproteobacteria bacterium]
MKRRFWLLALFGLAVGLGIPLLLGGRELAAVFHGLSWHLPAFLTLMIFIAWQFNVARVKLLLGGLGKKAGYLRLLPVVMATEFAYCATPGGAGGHLTYAYLLERFGITMPQGLALCATDQVMDILFFLSATGGILLYTLLAPTDLHPAWQLLGFGLLLLAVLAAIWVAILYFRPFLAGCNRLLRRLPVSAARRRRLLRALIDFYRGLQLVRRFSPLRLLGVYLGSFGYWLLRYSVLYVVVRGLGGRLSWSYCFLVQMLAHTVGQATMIPGGSGGAEASSGLLLAPVLGGGQTAAAILLWRFATFYLYLLAGGPAFALLAGARLWRQLTGGRDRQADDRLLSPNSPGRD